jgi:hypothetical protein
VRRQEVTVEGVATGTRNRAVRQGHRDRPASSHLVGLGRSVASAVLLLDHDEQ